MGSTQFLLAVNIQLIMDFKCLADNSAHTTQTDLHAHLRSLKMKQSEYYERFHPKHDMLTGEVIPFKDIKTYFKVDFLNKNNLNKWAKKNPQEALSWTMLYLAERKKDKNLSLAPSHFELRTLFCPNVKFIEEHGDYNELCGSIGLGQRYDYKSDLKFNKLPDNFIVKQDSREQTPVKFINQQVGKLNYGDYTLDQSINSNIFIERKALGDAVSTFSRDYERFYREVERAKKDNAYLIVMVEVDYNTFASFNKDYRMRYATKATPEHVLKNMRDLLLDFDNLQFCFVDGRVEFAKKMIKIFELGEQAKKTDLQFSLEKGLL